MRYRDTSPEGMAEKVRYVAGVMDRDFLAVEPATECRLHPFRVIRRQML